MKNLLLILFISSVLVIYNSANALECPGVFKDAETDNIVNLSDVIIQNNGVQNADGSALCVYNYISSNTHKQKTVEFEYIDNSYLPVNSNNWKTGVNNITCTSENPADCEFSQENTNFVSQLQRCPDEIIEAGGSVDNFQFGRYRSPGPVGVTQCVYTNIKSKFEYDGLYFDSTVEYSGPTWFGKNGGISCTRHGDDNDMDPDQCEFYLAN